MNMHHPPATFKLTLQKQGAAEYQKVSFPIHAGIYSELESRDYIFQFNLNHEIMRMKRKGECWPHPHEWLKRNLANDWIYYSTGGYTGVFEATGEYYLPNFQYPTNSLLGGKPFNLPEVQELVDNWYTILQEMHKSISPEDSRTQDFFTHVLENSPAVLEERKSRLHEMIGGSISVLPPDARHVDYNVIPLAISRGCLYKCRFCKVKNHQPFTAIDAKLIQEEASRLAAFLGDDLLNYNSVFLGDHDALQAGPGHILEAAEISWQAFKLHNSYCRDPRLFLFGSVTSLLNAPEELFKSLSALPFQTHINIGLESADQATLDRIGKPITSQNVTAAFMRMQEINTNYLNIETTANFIMDDDLPEGHYPAILSLIRDSQQYTRPKGSIYFSPLSFSAPSRARLFDFHRLKVLSRFPTFLYIIQRL